jgi:glutamate carboxypeptidase
MTKRTVASLLLLCANWRVAAAQSAVPLTPVESTMVRSVDAENPAALALLEKLVDINSGTMNLAGVVAVKDEILPLLEGLGFKVRWVPMEQVDGRAGDLVAVHACPLGAEKCGKRLLLIGHMDTVFEKSSSFQTYTVVSGDGNIATGPGVCDMKGGLVVMLAALKAMQSAGVLDTAEIRIVLSGDEERHGEPVEVARKDMIDAAKMSDVALEFENSVRLKGVDTISIARRSSITWRLDTTAKSGHSSQIFSENMGYGAIYEMTRILDGFRTELPESGLTFNVGMVLAGSTVTLNSTGTGGNATGKSNVVPPVGLAMGDLRTLDNDQTGRIEAKMRGIVEKHLAKTGATIEFSEGYPAMQATEAGHDLVRQLNAVNATLGLPPMPELDPMLRGAGDIAFVAPYVPGLVGVGAMGEGAHAEGESVYLDSIAKQAKRNALLMYRLSQEK